MATIDNLDLNVYNLYAIRTRMIEQINSQLRLDQASSIPPQIQVMNAYPTLTELDLLLGITPLNTPWAYFRPPSKFIDKRRSPFGFARIMPSLGTQEDQEEDQEKAEQQYCETEEEESEKKAIKACFTQITNINQWLKHIVGRMGQFLQG
ncbi:MAG: DUF5399 domain-containing protein [Parachlamydiaceae bacterium]|nr:DUF5399 domain-containing protein [Parachlamydiaceae bacterium]